jgi:hypothetical protein
MGKQQQETSSVYQKEISSWNADDLQNKLNDCERNLLLNVQDTDKRKEVYSTLASKWLPASPKRDEYGLPIDINKEDLDRLLEKRRITVNICGYMLARADLLEISKNETEDINGDKMSFERRIKRFRECYKKVVQKFVDNDSEYRMFNQPLAENPDVDFDLGEDSSAYQTLLIYLLKQAYRHGYRRYRDQCCKEIRNTRAWKPVKEIKDFVYDETQKEDNAEMWKNLTNRGNMASDVIKHLSNWQRYSVFRNQKAIAMYGPLRMGFWTLGLSMKTETRREPTTCTFYEVHVQRVSRA